MTPDELRVIADTLDTAADNSSLSYLHAECHSAANKLRAHADALEAVLGEMDDTPLDDAVVTEQIQLWAKQLRGEHE